MTSDKGDMVPSVAEVCPHIEGEIDWDRSPFVYTGRWQQARTTLGVAPVRISIGPPRFLPGSGRYLAIKELMPFGLLGLKDRDEFTDRYRRRLDSKFGPEAIQQRFDALHELYEGPLMLCCYEDLTKPGEWCHRLIFAEWWKERTGQTILDLQLCEVGDEGSEVLQPPSLATPSEPEPAQTAIF